MKHWIPRSLRFQLSMGFILVLAVLVAFGGIGLKQLIDVNDQSELIRGHWLQSTRVLGDINNYTSDFRAAEASRLLANDPTTILAAERDLATLDQKIATAITNYERLPHVQFESDLFERFKKQWTRYRKTAADVIDHVETHQSNEAATLFAQASHSEYSAASDTLDALTSQTVSAAGVASSLSVVAYTHAKRWLLAALALALLATSILIIYINRNLSKPLSRLASDMRTLARRETAITINGVLRQDEIGEMARAVDTFRENAIDLETTQQRLIEQTKILEQRLVEEKRLTTLQRDFVSMVSHEFRTPLTIIDGHAQRLIKLRASLNSEDIEERSRKIRGAVLRVTHIMESLLVSARLFDSDPRLHFSLSVFEPRQLLADVCHLHREISPAAELVESAAGLPDEVLGDPHLLFQAVSNVLANAIKYSPANTEIRIDAGATDTTWWVTVADQGIGIPPADLPLLFEQYHRGSNVTGITGTGIGLYLVRTVVHLHGGQVTVESTLEQGACFRLELPRQPTSHGVPMAADIL